MFFGLIPLRLRRPMCGKAQAFPSSHFNIFVRREATPRDESQKLDETSAGKAKPYRTSGSRAAGTPKPGAPYSRFTIHCLLTANDRFR
jgi:hypothetical protein